MYIDDSLAPSPFSSRPISAHQQQQMSSAADRLASGTQASTSTSTSHRGSLSTSAALQQDGSTGVHAVIFVHGFQGTSTDLSLIKAHLKLLYPQLESFCSKANEASPLTR